MSYSAEKKWSELYTEDFKMAYPAEGVIRILKGTFPNLKMPKPQSGQSIIDLGCGDARHIPLFNSIGLKSYGVEISESIVQKLDKDINALGMDAEFAVGDNSNVPFEDNFFDYMLSWNSCYYMSLGNKDFTIHVKEMSRVIKPGGWLICSIPKSTCFIFRNSVEWEKTGYRIIKDDYFNKRDGEVMRCFSSADEVESEFGSEFSKFNFADIHMDWFGLNYHWFVFVAQKK